MTLILIITHSTDLGADLVLRHFAANSIHCLRVDTDRLGTPEYHFGFENGRPILHYDGRHLSVDEVSAVWARRFARPKALDLIPPNYRTFTSRELSQVMEAYLESISGLHVNTYEADRRAGNRLLQCLVAKSVGFLVPDTLVTQQVGKAEAFVRSSPGTVIAKAISFGALTETADQVVHTVPVKETADFAGVGSCPVLLQSAVPKHREWRITTVEHRVFAARTRFDASIDPYDWRRSANVEQLFEVSDLPNDVLQMMLTLCARSNIRFGTHDLIETPSSEFYFLETNPAGQWGWLEVTLGLPVSEALASVLASNGG